MAGKRSCAVALTVAVILALGLTGQLWSGPPALRAQHTISTSTEESLPSIPAPPARPGERSRQLRSTGTTRRVFRDLAGRAAQYLRSGFRAALCITAREWTHAVASRSALVIAPHPDDETLGCGGTILRKTSVGTAVTILVITDGRDSHDSAVITPDELATLRREEMRECAARLGLKDDAVRWAGIVDGTVTDCRDRLESMITDLIAEVEPHEIYVTSVHDPHSDHAAAGWAARRAVAASRSQPALLEYPIWLWNAWPYARGDRLRSTISALWMVLRRRAVVVDTAEYVDATLHALNAHASQVRRPGGLPADARWPLLPPELLAATARPVDLFLLAEVSDPRSSDPRPAAPPSASPAPAPRSSDEDPRR
jgi:LmbE family N-acetylglucosaminyl deacetylase